MFWHMMPKKLSQIDTGRAAVSWQKIGRGGWPKKERPASRQPPRRVGRMPGRSVRCPPFVLRESRLERGDDLIHVEGLTDESFGMALLHGLAEAGLVVPGRDQDHRRLVPVRILAK